MLFAIMCVLVWNGRNTFSHPVLRGFEDPAPFVAGQRLSHRELSYDGGQGVSLNDSLPFLKISRASPSLTSCPHFKNLTELMSLYKPRTWKGSRDTRYISTNHKTGTYLAACIIRLLGHGGIRAVRASYHTRGEGFTDSNFAINLVRNPFIMVHSGYSYHKKVGKESWLEQDPYTAVAQEVGVSSAYQILSEWMNKSCGSKLSHEALNASGWCKTFVSPKELGVYRNALQKAPFEQGLILEAMRTLHRDIPFMLIASSRCEDVTREAMNQTPVTGRCANIALDSIMDDYAQAYDEYIVPYMHVVGKAANWSNVFQNKCAPTSFSPKHSEILDDSRRSTFALDTKSLTRNEAIVFLRQVDKLLLGGILHEAEKFLNDRLAPAIHAPFRDSNNE